MKISVQKYVTYDTSPVLSSFFICIVRNIRKQVCRTTTGIKTYFIQRRAGGVSVFKSSLIAFLFLSQHKNE